MSELDFIAKYGPTGILGLLLLGAGRVGLKIIDRWFMLADKIEAALDGYLEAVRQQDVAAERRHSETRERIDSSSQAVRQAAIDAVEAMVSRMDRASYGERRRQVHVVDAGPED